MNFLTLLLFLPYYLLRDEKSFNNNIVWDSSDPGLINEFI